MYLSATIISAILAATSLITATPIPQPTHTVSIPHHLGTVSTITTDFFGKPILHKTDIISKVNNIVQDEFGRGIIRHGNTETISPLQTRDFGDMLDTPCHSLYKVIENENGKSLLEIPCM